MFIGHFAVGFALKKAEPKVPLGVWFAAAMFLDILWPVFLLIGIEKASVVPGITVVTPLNLEVVHWSHSLLMSALWGCALRRGGLLARAHDEGFHANRDCRHEPLAARLFHAHRRHDACAARRKNGA